jgi:hypothetical protein
MALVWEPQGPQPTTRGQVEGILDREVAGAIQAVAAHPTDPAIIYVGAVNGGIWRTANATTARPSWTQLTDSQKSLSIGALEFDPTDATSGTLLAGTGRFSSMSRRGGALIGLLRTTDGGGTWTVLDNNGPFRSFHVTGVASRGSTIVFSHNTTATNVGVFRSTDTGATWNAVSGGAGAGLPPGIAFDLAGDPTDPARLFTHAGGSGVFRSDDTGATWKKVSNAAMDALLPAANNVKISVGTANNVYVAIAIEGQLAGLFRSGNAGGAWSTLDLPQTTEAMGVRFGTHPGRQASIHLSLAADRANAKLVYVGGDRQPGFDEGAPGSAPRWPNSIGARDYSGRLFRLDAGQPKGKQATHLTHSNTASQSAPHADSRDMAIAANGDLVEVDDGGVYRRTMPQANTGSWLSMNGDLQTAEFHSAVWDANTHTVIAGAQDTGTPQQAAQSNPRWGSVSTGDGGVVAVDHASTPGRSTRYSSYYSLGDFRRQVFDSAGVLLSETRLLLQVVGGGAQLAPQFYTPFVLNNATPVRLAIGASNGVYESDDQGDTVRAIAPGIRANGIGAMAYGAAGNADMLYVGFGATVMVRTAARPAPLVASATYPGNRNVVGIAIRPDDAQSAFVIDDVNVYWTANAGTTWTDITGNVLGFGGVVLRSVVFCNGFSGGAVVVGTNAGVVAASGPAFATWTFLESGLPTVPVLQLQYSGADRILLAATLGRGAWTVEIPAEATV